MYMYMYMYLSIYQSIYLCIYVSVYLYIVDGREYPGVPVEYACSTELQVLQGERLLLLERP